MNRRIAPRLAAGFLPWLMLAGAVLLVLSQLPRPAALVELWRPWAEIGALAAVMTAIMLTGGIDLSVGSMIALSGMVVGILWHDYHWRIELAAAAGVLTGFLAGAINGTLVVIGIAPLVATLATMAFYAGLALAISHGERIAGLPEGILRLGEGIVLGLPTQLWMLAIVFFVAYVIVHHTRFGRYLYAIGENRLAARFAAVPVARVEWTLYAMSGLVAGLVALAYTARSTAAVPKAAIGHELQVIACVVLGGTRVTGGAGGVGRTLLGLAVLAHLQIGLNLLGNQKFYLPWSDAPWSLNANSRLIALGMLVVAVAVWNERLASRRIALVADDS
jgi:rhamnose transport system permease protein